jgi:hypothetical protein
VALVVVALLIALPVLGIVANTARTGFPSRMAAEIKACHSPVAPADRTQGAHRLPQAILGVSIGERGGRCNKRTEHPQADFETCTGIAVAQGFFSHRLWVVSRKWWLAGLTALVAGTDFLFALVVMILGDRLGPLAHTTTVPGLNRLNAYGQGARAFVPRADRADHRAECAIVVFGLSLGNDVILASALTYFLLKTRAGFNLETDAIMTRLAGLALQTCAITVPIQVAIILGYHVLTDKVRSALIAHCLVAYTLPRFT